LISPESRPVADAGATTAASRARRPGRVPATAAVLLLVLLAPGPVRALTLQETPLLAPAVARGELPPVTQRLPQVPLVVAFDQPGQQPGQPGGELALLMARAKDTRLIYVYGYARLLAYRPDLSLEPDLLQALEVDPEQQDFTLHLRPGHRWSDGAPFTSEDFRYWWQEVQHNRELSPLGPTAELMVQGHLPEVSFPDPLTVRYRWPCPNPYFLHQLAGAKPAEIYAPAHYLKQFHPAYAAPEALAARVAAARQKSWSQLHHRRDNLSEFDNPELPTLQPWQVLTAPPAQRFVFQRNPYYHRLDPAGHQLPYIDRVVVTLADARLIPAKTGAGESDLQARYLRFDHYTFLKQAEQRNHYRVRLWPSGIGSQLAFYPNLNASDPVWRQLNREPRFRRALSLAIDRDEINQVVYYGLASPGNDTLLERSPLSRAEDRERWAGFDLGAANDLLDQLGLKRAGLDRMRRLPDGRPLDLIVETASDNSEESDLLELVADSWRQAGIRLFTKPSQLEVLRNRIYAGEAVMSVARGLDNAIATAEMSPAELAPVDQAKYQWPRWGQYHQTKGQAGEPPDLPAAQELLDLLHQWEQAADQATRAAVWRRMLALRADQQFTIGLVAGVPQPVVVRETLRNVPESAIYNYNPGAHFGLYRPDGFWFAQP